MKIQPTLHSLVVVLLAAATGCGGNHLLVGDDPDASLTGAAGTSGTAPTGAAGQATGAAGLTFDAGSADAPGTVTRQVKPLTISGAEALMRIAAVLWNDVPDADLLSQAAQGHFTSTSDLYGAIHQMLVDPRAATGVGAFYRWWLDLANVATVPKDATLFPTYTPALQADMANETETFAVKVTLDENGSYFNLLTQSTSFLNARLADIYGVANVQGDVLREVTLDPNQRSGLLTQPAILVQGTNLTANDPAMRGNYINDKFLCALTPAPPPDENSFTTPPPGVTLRSALTAAVQSGACQACHKLIDAPGYAFENFDAIGRWRTIDNGAPVDTTALQLDSFDPPVTVDGRYLFVKLLSAAPEAQRCMVRQWYAYVFKQRPTDIDQALVDETYPIFQSADFNLKELIVAVLTSDRFLASNGPI
jgi:Protein of unknown function (DUF1592)/Protein of unknown function (DUF1588)/Protein of unknown function (DUF1585)